MAKSYDVGIRITAKDETGPALTKTRAGVESISRQLESMRAYALGAFTGVAALGQAREVLALADAVQSMNARLRLAVGGADAFAAAQARAYAISARTGAGYEATATLMARLSTVAKGYGVTQEQVFRVTEATGNALKVSGAGAQETASVIRQLSQAMGSGVLRGDEFNAIMENGTRLAQALADGLNVPIGKLRGLAEQGLLTTDIMVKALESQRETLAAEAAAMPKTIGMAATRVADEFGRIVDAANQGSGATGIMASALDALAVNLETVLGGAAVAAVGGLALVTARGASAAFDYAKALYAQMAAERQAMAVTLAHKEAAVSYALADVMRAQTVVNQTKGMARLDQVVNTLIPAQQRLTAAQQALTAAQNAGGIAARALSGALGFVGGPLGAITLALTVGATDWALWGDKAETATSRARKSAEDAQAALDRLRDRKQYGEDELAPVRKGIAELEAALAEMRRTEIQWDPETGEPREVRGYSDSDIQAAQARLDKMRQDLANAQQELASQAQGLAGIAASGVTNIMESAFARLEQGYKDKLDPLAAELEKLRKAAAEAGIATDSERFKQAEQLARDIFAKKSDINVSIGDVGKQLRDKTVKAIKDGVQYEFGAKNLSSLVIDCSGFVTALHAPVVKGIVEAQKGALPEDMVAALKSSSDG
ncbi:MAG: tape measure protein, partial [Desulfovibrio sp.]|nr:tape measure protein [Desulfovibrio sp.]